MSLRPATRRCLSVPMPTRNIAANLQWVDGHYNDLPCPLNTSRYRTFFAGDALEVKITISVRASTPASMARVWMPTFAASALLKHPQEILSLRTIACDTAATKTTH